MASFLVDSKADVNKADAQRFTPLFWAVDRRNMETAPNFPWMVTADPLPLIRKLLDAGANPNALVNNTPRARMRGGLAAHRLRHRADAGGVRGRSRAGARCCWTYGADPTIVSKDGETMVSAAAGLAFIQGYHRGKSPAERLQVVKLFVELGNDVNQPDDYGITPLMAAANGGNVPMIQYLIDAGADLGAHDLGKKNDGQFGSSIEPLMPIDYAIGVGTFVPNNAVIIHEEAVALMAAADEGARHQAHHLRVHAARLHLRPGQGRPEGRDPGRDHAHARRSRSAIRLKGITGRPRGEIVVVASGRAGSRVIFESGESSMGPSCTGDERGHGSGTVSWLNRPWT